jgi:hypothetical protein
MSTWSAIFELLEKRYFAFESSNTLNDQLKISTESLKRFPSSNKTDLTQIKGK